MKLEKQVCSLELAKKLKGLGVKQDSLWYWVDNSEIGYKLARPMDFIQCYHGVGYSAFTVAELGEMLPRFINNNERKYDLATYKEIRNDEIEWCTRYECETNKGFWNQSAKTEADARAKMLIYLLENNLLKESNNDKR